MSNWWAYAKGIGAAISKESNLSFMKKNYLPSLVFYGWRVTIRKLFVYYETVPFGCLRVCSWVLSRRGWVCSFLIRYRSIFSSSVSQFPPSGQILNADRRKIYGFMFLQFSLTSQTFSRQIKMKIIVVCKITAYFHVISFSFISQLDRIEKR